MGKSIYGLNKVTLIKDQNGRKLELKSKGKVQPTTGHENLEVE
jgi:hypothetical protein